MFEFIPADAVEAVGKALARLRVLFEKGQRRVDDFVELLLLEDNRQEMAADRDAVAVEAAERDDKAGSALPGVRRAALDALAAVDALLRVEHDLALVRLDRDGLLGADGLADTAERAVVRGPLRLHAALDAEVILLGLEAVVVATREAELELVRQLAAAVALVEFVREVLRVDEARGADGTALAGRDRAHARAADADGDAALVQVFLDFVDVLEADKRDLDTLARGQVDVALAVLLGDLLDGAELGGGEVAADGLQAHREMVLLALAHEAAFLELFIINCHENSS